MIGGIGTIADLGISITSSILTRKLEAAAIRETTRLRIAEAAASGDVFEGMQEGSGAITKFAAVLGAAGLGGAASQSPEIEEFLNQTKRRQDPIR